MNNRALSPSDANAIAVLWLAGAAETAAVDPSFLPRVSLHEYGASLEAELRSGITVGWGAFAVQDDALLGYLTAQPREPSAEFCQDRFLYLLDLDVRGDARRRGIAAQLVALARRFAAAHELGSIEVSWLSSDERAAGFWRSQDFKPYLVRARSGH